MLAYLLARMTTLFCASFYPNVVISPMSPKTGVELAGEVRPQDIDVGAIIGRNFFDSKETPIAKVADSQCETPPCGKPEPVVATPEEETKPQNLTAVRTSLDIHLISTFYVGDGRDPRSNCVIQSGKTTDTYRVAQTDSFAPSTKITRILSKRVEFVNKDQLEYVDMPDFAKGMDPNAKPEKSALLDKQPTKVVKDDGEKADIQHEGNNFTIPRSEVDKALENLPKLYTDIRAVPYFKDGKADGFKLINVKASSLFEKLGLRRGDILKSINNTTLDLQSGLQTFNNLKNESSFTLAVERRGADQTFNYQIQ